MINYLTIVQFIVGFILAYLILAYLILAYLIVGFLIVLRLLSTDNAHVIPGMRPRSKDMGNFKDIGEAGSFHQFLLKLHREFGNIASFWFGPTRVVSISSADYFKQQQNLFDRPPLLFSLLEPFIGPESLQYANGDDGKSRRKAYDRTMSHKAVVSYIKDFENCALEIVKSLKDELKDGADCHPLCDYMAKFALKVDLLTLFGNVADEGKIKDFHNNYSVCWSEMESRLGGTFPEPGSEREHNFEKALEAAKGFVKEVVTIRETMDISEDEERFIDVLMSHSVDEKTLLSDAITYVTGGFPNTANSLAWAFYFLAENQDIQEKLICEIDEQVGKEGEINIASINKCTYLKQVFDETLRCSVLAPFAARFFDEELKLGEYTIPAGTPVLHALGVSLQDPTVFPDPEKFDPDRFSPENSKKRATTAFQPFGVGKRICPGHRFANVEAAVCLIVLLRTFKVGLVPNQDIKPVHGLVTHPSSEVKITLEERK